LAGAARKHREEVGYGSTFYRWLAKNDFPDGYRVACFNCNSAIGAYGYCPHHKDRYHLNFSKHPAAIATRERNVRKKLETLSHYGGACTDCGETQYEFLTFDHINDDGAQYRKEFGRRSLCEWLWNRDFPDGFAVRCFGCNWLRHIKAMRAKQALAN
jgi:hypothetical protein